MITQKKEMIMENQGGRVREEQYIDTKYIRERLMVSRTTAHKIMKEIEKTYAPDAVIRIGRCLRVRKDVFFRWVDEQGTGGEGSRADASVAQRYGRPDLRLTGWANTFVLSCPRS